MPLKATFLNLMAFILIVHLNELLLILTIIIKSQIYEESKWRLNG